MTVRVVKPYSSQPLADPADSLSVGQIGWWLANEGSGGVLRNIANPARFNGALQADVSRGVADWGTELVGAGTANSYVDLGTDSLIGQSQPFTLSWLERPAASPPAYAGLATFMPTGSSQRWIMFRDDTDANFRYLSFGFGLSALAQFAAAPTLASGVGVTRHFVVIGASGMTGATNSFLLLVDGVSFGFSSTSGNAAGSITPNLNYLGWDGADSKWKGGFQNFRLWNRQLTSAELTRLIANPFAGASVRRVLVGSGAAPVANLGSMLLAM